MERIKLSDVSPERLAGLTQPVIIVDEAGNHVGYLQPQPVDWEEYLDELSPEEWERREKAGGRPLSEYLQELEHS